MTVHRNYRCTNGCVITVIHSALFLLQSCIGTVTCPCVCRERSLNDERAPHFSFSLSPRASISNRLWHLQCCWKVSSVLCTSYLPVSFIHYMSMCLWLSPVHLSMFLSYWTLTSEQAPLICLLSYWTMSSELVSVRHAYV